MGIVTKNVGGDEYVYILAGKKQFFLGRKGDSENFNQKNLFKAAGEFDKTIDRQLNRYVESILICTKYMQKNDASTHLTKRRMKINQNLLNLK